VNLESDKMDLMIGKKHISSSIIKFKIPKKLSVLCLILFSIISCGEKNNSEEKVAKNRLSEANSPYLVQHADNPVDWYEWGPEALEKAAQEDKPIIISVGYAACHWCHVMEEESFMDPGVAETMNRDFISIKIDREERPDIDKIYMNAAQLLNGSGGWPLNIIALPNGKPRIIGWYVRYSYGWMEIHRWFGQVASLHPLKMDSVPDGPTGQLYQIKNDPLESTNLFFNVLI